MEMARMKHTTPTCSKWSSATLCEFGCFLAFCLTIYRFTRNIMIWIKERNCHQNESGSIFWDRCIHKCLIIGSLEQHTILVHFHGKWTDTVIILLCLNTESALKKGQWNNVKQFIFNVRYSGWHNENAWKTCWKCSFKKRNKKDNRLDRWEKYITGKFLWRSQCFEPHSSGDKLKSATL